MTSNSHELQEACISLAFAGTECTFRGKLTTPHAIAWTPYPTTATTRHIYSQLSYSFFERDIEPTFDGLPPTYQGRTIIGRTIWRGQSTLSCSMRPIVTSILSVLAHGKSPNGRSMSVTISAWWNCTTPSYYNDVLFYSCQGVHCRFAERKREM